MCVDTRGRDAGVPLFFSQSLSIRPQDFSIKSSVELRSGPLVTLQTGCQNARLSSLQTSTSWGWIPVRASLSMSRLLVFRSFLCSEHSCMCERDTRTLVQHQLSTPLSLLFGFFLGSSPDFYSPVFRICGCVCYV